jgi:hypothetical protein
MRYAVRNGRTSTVPSYFENRHPEASRGVFDVFGLEDEIALDEVLHLDERSVGDGLRLAADHLAVPVEPLAERDDVTVLLGLLPVHPLLRRALHFVRRHRSVRLGVAAGRNMNSGLMVASSSIRSVHAPRKLAGGDVQAVQTLMPAMAMSSPASLPVVVLRCFGPDGVGHGSRGR